MSLVDTVKNAFVPSTRRVPVHRRLCGRHAAARAVFDQPVLDRPDPHCLVRLFLPRSGARDADRRPAGHQPRRRRRLLGRPQHPAAAELGLGSGEMTRISVFMNVFSCHVNRAPVRGRITRIEHRPGKFLNAELDKASQENERNGLVIDSPNGTGRRRAGCRAWSRAASSAWAEAGGNIAIGERFGLIRFGSRCRRLPAAGRHAARFRRPDGGRRRDGDRRIRRPGRDAARAHRLMVFRPFPAARQERTAHPRDPAAHGAAQPDHRAGDLRRPVGHPLRLRGRASRRRSPWCSSPPSSTA